jgi:hypothetical protein
MAAQGRSDRKGVGHGVPAAGSLDLSLWKQSQLQPCIKHHRHSPYVSRQGGTVADHDDLTPWLAAQGCRGANVPAGQSFDARARLTFLLSTVTTSDRPRSPRMTVQAWLGEHWLCEYVPPAPRRAIRASRCGGDISWHGDSSWHREPQEARLPLEEAQAERAGTTKQQSGWAGPRRARPKRLRLRASA